MSHCYKLRQQPNSAPTSREDPHHFTNKVRQSGCLPILFPSIQNPTNGHPILSVHSPMSRLTTPLQENSPCLPTWRSIPHSHLSTQARMDCLCLAWLTYFSPPPELHLHWLPITSAAAQTHGLILHSSPVCWLSSSVSCYISIEFSMLCHATFLSSLEVSWVSCSWVFKYHEGPFHRAQTLSLLQKNWTSSSVGSTKTKHQMALVLAARPTIKLILFMSSWWPLSYRK